MDKRPDRNEEDNRVLAYALSTQLKLLHPYVPLSQKPFGKILGKIRCWQKLHGLNLRV